MNYEKDKKSFLERVRSLDESGKRMVLVGATAIVVAIVIYVWVGYFSGLVSVSQPAVAENQPAQTSSGPGFWQNLRNGMASIAETLRGPGQYTIKPN